MTEIGIALDAWRHPFHGGWRKAILLITIEGIGELVSQGFRSFRGALGENLTTRGLDRRELRLGQRFRVGDAGLELTYLRTPCTTRDAQGSSIQVAIYDAEVQAGDSESPRWRLSGFYASVVRPGTVRAGDTIARLD